MTKKHTKHILVLVSSQKISAGKFVETLQRKLTERDREGKRGYSVEIELGLFSDLSFIFGDNVLNVMIKGKDITKYDLIYMRKVGHKNTIIANSLGICLKHLHIPFYDSVFGDYGAKGNKFKSLIQLSVSGVPIPKSIYFCSPLMEESYNYLKRILGAHFVAKDLGLQRGTGIFLIKNQKDLDSLPYKNGSQGKSVYLYQELIEKDHEYRTVILGSEVGVWYEKLQANEVEFRYNTSLGATEVFLHKDNTPSYISEPAIAAAKALKIEIAGVDIVIEKRTHKVYILEVNRGPGLSIYNDISVEYDAVAEFFEKGKPLSLKLGKKFRDSPVGF